MRSHISFLLLITAIFISSSNALLTPSRNSSPSTFAARTTTSTTTKIVLTSTHQSASSVTDLPRGGGDTDKSKTISGGTASIPNEVFNLIKSIVGAGVLSLPAGKLFLHFSCCCGLILYAFLLSILFLFDLTQKPN